MEDKNVWDQHRAAIAGVWKCIEYEMFDTSQHKLIAKPHGENPLGRVSISPNGWLSAHLARPERMHPLRSGKPWQTASDKEVAYVTKGLSMYCGYLKLYEDGEGGLYWQTKVEISSDPNRMGGLEERRVKLFQEEGKEYMVLEPKQDMLLDDGTKTRAVLKWEKFESVV